jgi:hypothetical protein
MKLAILGFCFVIFILVFFLIAVVMLISPNLWFRMPSWLRFSGSLSAKRYASGWGAVQVRITGAILLGGLVWMVYSMLSRRH